MTAITYTVYNYSTMDATLTQITFTAPGVIPHEANLSNFGGYLAGATAFTGTGTRPTNTADYVSDTRPENAVYVASFNIGPNFYLEVDSTNRIQDGWEADGNGYTSGQTVISVTSSTWLRMSAAPSFPPTVGQAVTFSTPDVYLFVDDVTGIEAGDIASGNGYSVGQTVVAKNSGLNRLTMSDYPNGAPTIGGTITFTDQTPISVLPAGSSTTFIVNYTAATTVLDTYARDIFIDAILSVPVTKTVNNLITLSNAPVPPAEIPTNYYFPDAGGDGGGTGPGPCTDSSSVSCAAPAAAASTECFTADTLVTMADGTKKRIADIKEGDYVQGVHGHNKVLQLLTFVAGTNRLHGFNNSEPFVTACHPIKTDKGWSAFDPEYLKEHWPSDWLMLVGENNGPVEKITENSLIGFWRNGVETYEAMQGHTSIEVPEDFTVYNLMLDKDHTFVANDVIVHNKGECFTGDTLINIAGGTTKRIDQIQIGDLVIDALTGLPNQVIGIKVTDYEAGRRLFSTKAGVKPFITEQHAFYDDENKLCAMSNECEYLAPWLGPVKIVDVPEIETAQENITVYNLILRNGNSHYANGVPVSNMVGHGGMYVLVLKGFLSKEEYEGYIYHLENTVGLNSLTQERKARVFEVVFKMTRYILDHDNIQSWLLAKTLSWAVRNRTTVYPYIQKWFNSRIRNWIFGK